MSSIPKWFIYNACRGPFIKNPSSSSTVTTVNAQVTGDATPFSGDPRHYPTSFTFPEDILLSWASEDNYQCFRNPVNGSWFINEIVKVGKFHNFSRSTCLDLYFNEGPGGTSRIEAFTRNAGHRHQACGEKSR